MDLLKDNNYVPETDHSNSPIMQNIENALDAIAKLIKTSTTRYSFMDLLGDKGYVPQAQSSNHSILQDIEEAFDAVAAIVRTNTEDYNFMNLLSDNGYVPSNDYWVPKPSNDNDILIKVAS